AVALLWPDVGLKEVHGFSVPMAAKLDARPALPLRTLVQGARPHVEARLLSDFVDGSGRTLVKDRLHAQARFVLGEALPPRALEDAGRVLPWLARGGSSMDTCYLDPDQTTLGPRFRSIQWLRVFGRSEVLARVERPLGRMFGHTHAPRFQLDPFLLDGCFQTAAMLGVWHTHLASLPAGFEVLRLYGTPEEGQPLYVHARLLSTSGERATYDLDAFDARGRLCWRMERYQEYLLFPLTHRGVEKLTRLVGESRLETPLRSGGRGEA
ncbi:MAG TPA: polyketide synthase dehydratase domain-containing protein, partial [Myxococcus sp.]|nr:polyketide synthase dehydratase domain-containing protein [Myxococcus sp.]